MMRLDDDDDDDGDEDMMNNPIGHKELAKVRTKRRARTESRKVNNKVTHVLFSKSREPKFGLPLT